FATRDRNMILPWLMAALVVLTLVPGAKKGVEVSNVPPPVPGAASPSTATATGGDTPFPVNIPPPDDGTKMTVPLSRNPEIGPGVPNRPPMTGRVSVEATTLSTVTVGGVNIELM